MSLQNTTYKTSDAFDTEPSFARDEQVRALAEAAGGQEEVCPHWIRRITLSLD